MKTKIMGVLGAALLAAVLWAGPAAQSETLDSIPEVRQQFPEEWQRMHQVQRELHSVKASVRKQMEELRTLAHQKQVKPDMIAFLAVMQKIEALSIADKQLVEELSAAAEAKDGAKMQKIVAAMTTHKQQKINLFKEAETLLQSAIKQLKSS